MKTQNDYSIFGQYGFTDGTMMEIKAFYDAKDNAISEYLGCHIFQMTGFSSAHQHSGHKGHDSSDSIYIYRMHGRTFTAAFLRTDMRR